MSHPFRYLIGLISLIGPISLISLAADPAAQAPPPRIFQSDGRDLLKSKARAADDKQVAAAIAALVKSADKELKTTPLTVVNKPKAPSSGDKHDYVSMAPYFWPDPDKPDGLPYIRKDGKVNPERTQYDEPLLNKMTRAVSALAQAYYFTGEERYAEHATKLLQVWFLDEKTRMNPNLNYGQFIPGVNEGRGIGIIETVAFLQVIDGVGLLEGSKSWTAAEQKGLQEWFTAYLQWLRTSKNGKDEAAAKNNHGTFYDVQVATYALFVGEDEAGVKKLLEEAKTKRIARQIEPDGKQPLELVRTKAFDYSQANLRGLFALATLGDRVGVDLWNFETADGRSIRKALDFLIPFATGEKKWEHEQLNGVKGESLALVLRRATVAYKEEGYEKQIEKVSAKGDLGTAGLYYPKVK